MPPIPSRTRRRRSTRRRIGRRRPPFVRGRHPDVSDRAERSDDHDPTERDRPSCVHRPPAHLSPPVRAQENGADGNARPTEQPRRPATGRTRYTQAAAMSRIARTPSCTPPPVSNTVHRTAVSPLAPHPVPSRAPIPACHDDGRCRLRRFRMRGLDLRPERCAGAVNRLSAQSFGGPLRRPTHEPARAFTRPLFDLVRCARGRTRRRGGLRPRRRRRHSRRRPRDHQRVVDLPGTLLADLSPAMLRSAAAAEVR